MSKKFYKDIKVIRFCKECGVEYRPQQKDDHLSRLRLCWKCRKPHYAKWYKEHWIPWFESLSPERQEEIKASRQKTWQIWVANNKEKRRTQALASYHRNKNKPKNKNRKHIKTSL